MHAPKQRPASRPSVFTVPAAAAELGCSESHVYRLIAAGELRAVDIGTPGSTRAKTRVRADDIAAYIERRTPKNRTATR